MHADCKGSLCEKCDLGTYRNFILPPDCVDIRKVGSRRKKQVGALYNFLFCNN